MSDFSNTIESFGVCHYMLTMIAMRCILGLVNLNVASKYVHSSNIQARTHIYLFGFILLCFGLKCLLLQHIKTKNNVNTSHHQIVE